MKGISGLLVLLWFFNCCETQDHQGIHNNNDGVDSLVFYSLSADRDTISKGETAKITAMATGFNLTFSWSATAGSILGSGNEINYVVNCSCSAGKNTVTCIVTDGYNDSKSKEVSIFVK